jgi:ketosteroid isomerase-like protein
MGRAVTTEERIRRLEDLEAIRELFHTYADLLDRRDLAGYSRLFTDDAEWHGGRMRARGGPPAILAMLRERYHQDEPADDRHLVANPVIRIEGDRARATSRYAVIGRGLDGRPELRLIGEYVDDLRRGEDGRWRFAYRQARVDLAPDVTGAARYPADPTTTETGA